MSGYVNENNLSKQNNVKSSLTAIDKRTGEVIEIDALINHPKKLRISGFFMVMQEELQYLAKMKLRGEALNVLLFLMGRMDYENSITLAQKEICNDLDMKSPNVSRAIKVLKKFGIIDRHSLSTFHLNSAYGWKGKIHNLRVEENLKKAESIRASRENHVEKSLDELCKIPPDRVAEIARKNKDFLDQI